MAVSVKLWSGRNETQDTVIRYAKEAEANSKKEYNSAVKIQSWFHGCRVRAYLKHLHEKATIIQRQYRGYLGRKYYRKILKENLHKMREDYYQAMAIKIQSCWRGYYVRLRVFDYKAFREYIEALKIKNQKVRDRLKEVHEREEAARAQLAQEMEEMKLQEEAVRCHYQLSTVMKDGVFKKTRRSFEERMRNIHFTPHHPVRIRKAEEAAKAMEEKDKCQEFYVCQQRRRFRYCHCQGTLTPSPSNHLLESVRDDIRRDETGHTLLPPLVPVQGPFKDPAKVLWQKVKPLEPTLRVASDYKSVKIAREKQKAEELQRRVIEEPLNVPCPHRWKEPYDPLIHTSHPFRGRPDLYTFRENKPHKNISNETFRTLISPIPLFDKFNRTY